MYDTKQRHILKNALKLFRLYGLKAVTMDEIAQAAGMSKKTIYTYFNDKHEMVDALYKSITRVVEHRLIKIQQEETTVVYKYIRVIELAMGAGNYITAKLMEELKKYHSATHNKIQLFIDKKFMPAITQLIDQGISEGLFQPFFNSNLMAMVCLSELDFLNDSNNKKLSSLSGADIRQQLTRHLLNGISTAAGKKQADKYFSITQS